MSFLDAISICLSKYATFQGRASRSEFWWFYLFTIMVYAILYPLGIFVSSLFFILYFLFFIATFIPSISVTIRRLHDTNHSGWWYWISLIPLIGIIWLIVLLIFEGDDGLNDYGYSNLS